MAFNFLFLTFVCSTAFVGYLLGLDTKQIGLLVVAMIGVTGLHYHMMMNVIEHGEHLDADEAAIEAQIAHDAEKARANEEVDRAKLVVQQKLSEHGMDIDLEDIGTSTITHTSKEHVGTFMGHPLYEYVIINGKYMYTYESTTTKGADGKWLHKCAIDEMLTGNGVIYKFAGRVSIEVPTEDEKAEETH